MSRQLFIAERDSQVLIYVFSRVPGIELEADTAIFSHRQNSIKDLKRCQNISQNIFVKSFFAMFSKYVAP